MAMEAADYEQLRSRALSPKARKGDIDRLGKWFERFGADRWNGDSYDAGDGVLLVPIYYFTEYGDDCLELVGYEIRQGSR